MEYIGYYQIFKNLKIPWDSSIPNKFHLITISLYISYFYSLLILNYDHEVR